MAILNFIKRPFVKLQKRKKLFCRMREAIKSHHLHAKHWEAVFREEHKRYLAQIDNARKLVGIVEHYERQKQHVIELKEKNVRLQTELAAANKILEELNSNA